MTGVIMAAVVVGLIGLLIDTIGNGSDITYSNTDSKLSSTTAQDALDEIYALGHRCPDDHTCFKKKDTLALGDYVKMTPTKSSYTTDTSKTGYTSSQTINPRELNLWRVISINDGGTVDIISEHISSTAVYFKGQTGYQNFVGYLNVLASQYENSTYTKGSRHFGYNGQTEYITDTSKITETAPWECSTGESCNPVESQGGGDELYTKDYNLVKSVLGTAGTTKQDGTSGFYWMASRYYLYYSSNSYELDGQYVNASGDVGTNTLYNYDGYDGSSFTLYDNNFLRPILTLKSGLKYTGSGTKDDPVVIVT